MFTITWILSVSFFIVSFFGIIFSSALLTEPVDEEKFSFLRVFPFEAMKLGKENGRYYSIFSYLFSGVCFTPLLVVLDGSSMLSGLKGISILIACIFGLAGLCFVFLNIFDVTHTKAHLILFGIFALLTLLATSLAFGRALSASNILNKHNQSTVLLIISEVLSAICFVYILCIIFNPKLMTWAKLDQVDGEENKYKRPKKFPLAYSEWGILLALFSSELIYFIQLLVK